MDVEDDAAGIVARVTFGASSATRLGRGYGDMRKDRHAYEKHQKYAVQPPLHIVTIALAVYNVVNETLNICGNVPGLHLTGGGSCRACADDRSGTGRERSGREADEGLYRIAMGECVPEMPR